MDKKLDCDVLIIGGGINGCGIAADAASRGLNVILCEKNDLGSATSSASSKLIHGGLRYLEQYNFSLVRKALKEREVLLKICPYLIKPLKFILPYKKYLRAFWLIKLGVFLYDLLCKTSLANSQSLSRITDPNYFKPLNKNINRALSYYDAKTDDSRLVILNALQAKKFNGQILTRSEFISTQRKEKSWLSTIKTKHTQLQIQSKLLINATGPWADQLNKSINIKSPFHLSLVQGSHLIVDKLYEGDFAYILQNKDNRIIFTIPYHKQFTLIGTTERLIKKISRKCTPHAEEITYLLTITNQYFNKQLNKNDVKHTYCGLRPLIKQNTATLTKNISRDYKIYSDQKLAPYICIYGGKLTTYRLLAKECVDAWSIYFPNLKDSKTKELLLPGSDFTTIKALKKDLINAYPYLPENLLNYYATNYGSRAFSLLKECNKPNDLGQCFSDRLYQKEIDFLIKTEWAETVDDIIWRRTKQGLYMTKLQIKNLQKYISSLTN